MRIAFYAPMNSPETPEPSGDRRVARALISALNMSGNDVAVASHFRSYEGKGNTAIQEALQSAGQRIADAWIAENRANPPELWFTYHLYHKAPDWLGPTIADHFGIPYVVAEASHAPKQADGPWQLGHGAARRAMRRADRIISLNPTDEPCVKALRGGSADMHYLPPFLALSAKPTPEIRQSERQRLARQFNLDSEIPWLLSVAMMRPGVKQQSYECLAAAMSVLATRRCHLLIVGDGSQRQSIESCFKALPRVSFLGLGETALITSLAIASDLFVWPAIEEGFGMALLEAQAAGLPVVAGYTPGVASIVIDGKTGLLTPAGNPEAFASAINTLLDSDGIRQAQGIAAREKVECFHSMQTAAAALAEILRELMREKSG